MDKDPGEEFFHGSQKGGFDYYSAHLYLKNSGRIKTLAIGDYKLMFGQGIALSSGLAFGKSADAVKIKRYNRKILAYTSTNESSLFRGIAAEVSITRKIDLSLFFSRKKRDANIVKADTSAGSEMFFSSLSESGYHRTIGEIDKRASIKESMFGGNASYRSKRFFFDITCYSTRFNIPQRRASKPYSKYYFNGRENRIVSI